MLISFLVDSKKPSPRCRNMARGFEVRKINTMPALDKETESRLKNVDPSKSFQFIGVQDCGETCCPHCGAEGRYIYTWVEFGVFKSAMAGCYAGLTGQLQRGDYDKFMQRLAEKQARPKPLTGYYKYVARMLQYKHDNINDEGKVKWAEAKIKESISACKQYSFKGGPTRNK